MLGIKFQQPQQQQQVQPGVSPIAPKIDYSRSSVPKTTYRAINHRITPENQLTTTTTTTR